MTKDDIKTIYEDEYFTVLEKPCGVVVNRSNTSPTDTVQDFVDDTFEDVEEEDLDDTKMSDEDTEEFKSRSGIVHRLDKDTSGVLLVAKDSTTFFKLKELFKTRTVQKEYVAVVLGEVKHPKIEIDAPIKRSPKNPMKLAVVDGGKPALTLVEKVKVVQKDDTKFTLLSVFPKTGRTHQIRVHLSALNHPIAGDPIYLTRFNYELTSQYFDRLMLHAHKISFVHPYSGEQVAYTAELPEEFLI